MRLGSSLFALFFAPWAAGCQVIGGLPGELTLESGPGGTGIPSREPLIWNAEDPGPLPEMLYALPDWMHFQSFSDGTTSEIAPGTIRLGYKKNDPRARNVGFGYGLLLEPTATNFLPSSAWAGDGWTAGAAPNGPMAQLFNVPDPAGGAQALTYRSDLGDQQSFFAMAEGGRTASAWLRGQSNMDPAGYFALGAAYVVVSGSDAAWRRYDVSRTVSDADARVRLETQAIAGAPALGYPSDISAYGAQVEDGMYPSSYIPTNGAPVFRENDRLYGDTSTFAPEGFFDVTMRFAPHYATSEQTYEHDLVAIHDDGVFVRLRVGGSLVMHAPSLAEDLRVEGLVWKREQTLEVRARYLLGGCELSVSGASEGGGSVKGTGAMAPIEQNGIWLLGDDSGPQEGADLKYLEFK